MGGQKGAQCARQISQHTFLVESNLHKQISRPSANSMFVAFPPWSQLHLRMGSKIRTWDLTLCLARTRVPLLLRILVRTQGPHLLRILEGPLGVEVVLAWVLMSVAHPYQRALLPTYQDMRTCISRHVDMLNPTPISSPLRADASAKV